MVTRKKLILAQDSRIIAAAEKSAVWRVKVLDDKHDAWWRSCLPCVKCGRSFYFTAEREEPYVCYGCRRRLEKGKRKKKRGGPSNPQHSKPLSPGGHTFVPDKMVHLKHWRTIPKDDVDRRQNRKRQRRVDKYFIELELYPTDLD